MNSVNRNSVSLQRNSEGSDVGFMSVELMLNGSARVFFSVTKFNLMLVLGSQPLDHVCFSSDQSLVVSDLVDVNLNLSVVNSDLMAQMMNIFSVPSDHSLMSADLLVIVFTFKFSLT